MGTKIKSGDIEIYHIGYSADTCANKPDEYFLIDNSENSRSDWFEYWPIREFLKNKKLEDHKYYGFLSPRFQTKTGFGSKELFGQINAIDDYFDVITICPQPEVGHIFRNIFYGSDFTDPGCIKTCHKLFKILGIDLDVLELVTDSRHTVFSNYIVAKKKYWDEWLDVCEKIFNLAENELNKDLFDDLNKYTNYGKGSQRKIFIIEGIATIILALGRYNIFNIEINSELAGKGNFYQASRESLVCDGLKIAFNQTGNYKYLKFFDKISNEIINEAVSQFKSTESGKMKQTPAHDKYNDSILSLLLQSKPASVIEVGCMRGTLAKEYLSQEKNCIWTGVDIDSDNVIEARNFCTHSILGNIENMDLFSIPNIEGVECWIFGDVLEHLRDPWALLDKIKNISNSPKKVIACIPNSQHWSFQVRVNAGMFDYQDDGLFDRTHIRFFSRETMIKMFTNAGFEIQSMHSRNFNFPGYEKYMPSIRTMASISGVSPEQAEMDAMAYQYVIEAVAK